MTGPIQGSNQPEFVEPPRQAFKRSAQGLLTENYPSGLAATASILVSGTIYYLAQGLMGGDVVNGFALAMSTPGSGLTLSRVALLTKGAVPLVQTPDVSSVFIGAAGKVKCSLAAPYVVPTSDGVYVGLITVGTTPPTLLRASSQFSAGAPLTGVAFGEAGSQAAQADIVNPGTPGFGTVLDFWCGIF